MQHQNYLGIFLGKERAVVVCLEPCESLRMIDCFTVSIAESEEKSFQLLARMIASACSDRQIDFGEVAVGLDCSIYMQHNLHSSFTDPRQIAHTVRFDTEEALATDVSDLALTFNVTATDDSGSNITVFTIRQKIIAELLSALQSNGFDPVTIEPDSICLARCIGQKTDLAIDTK